MYRIYNTSILLISFIVSIAISVESLAQTARFGDDEPLDIQSQLVKAILEGDFPFLFLIIDDRTGLLLFAGRVVEP